MTYLFNPGDRATHLPSGLRVQIFGREREKADQTSRVLYYWVFDGQKRFKAKPEQLQK
jgi:hypothetical protein